MNVARLLNPGMGATIQDLGRPGWARFGVPPSGAMDASAMRHANLLVGNHPASPVLELLMHGAEIAFLRATWLAVTGAENSCAIASGTARKVPAGTVLRFRASGSGVWIYLAIPGGWKAARWLGSASANPRAGMGASLGKGAILASGGSPLFSIPDAVAMRKLSNKPAQPPKTVVLQVFPGPQYADFSASARRALEATLWTVSPDSDRTGYRMDGACLEPGPEIISQPLTPGTIQVPGNGKPIVTMPDGPTVGGYPQIGWMAPPERSTLAQAAPGSHIQFQVIR